MTDCPHEHEPDTGLQTFKDIIREEFDQPSDSLRRDRPHRGVRRLQGLVHTQPSQPGQRTPSLQLRVGDLQSRNAQHTRTQVVQGHPARHRNNPSGCSGCRHFENFFAPGVADSPKVIQANSTPDIPLTPLHPYHVQQSKDPGFVIPVLTGVVRYAIKARLLQPGGSVQWEIV